MVYVKGMYLFQVSPARLTCPLTAWMLSANFLQAWRCHIFNRDKIQQTFPGENTDTCINVILRIIPRDSYKFTAAGNVDDELTVVLVINTGDDEEYLRKTLKIPDDDDTFRQAVHYYMKPGVWPTHE